MAVTNYTIECEGLTKKFGKFTAVDAIDLKVKKGELFGFLGPNGAGKTTTINMLTTLHVPTAGRARVAGFDLKKDAASVRSRIAVVPQSFALFNELTPMENLWYIGKLFGMKHDEIVKKSEELLKRVGLFEFKDTVCEGFSGGMKQRLSVAAGLLHTPEILFMDEPTTGLDPQSRIELRHLTKELNKSGITVVYTTHDMEEADKLCERIAIMDHGKIIALGTADELKEKYGQGHHMEIEVSRPSAKLGEELKEIAGAESVSMENHTIVLHTKAIKRGAVEKITEFLSRRGITMHDLRIREPSLEAVFINLTQTEKLVE